MIDGKSVLGVIPARGGSKGVPRKNVRLLAGRPLIAWTIQAGQASGVIDRLVVSSEDAEIIQIAREWGCEVPFVRPASLAADDTPGMAPILHAVAELPGFDFVVALQPTSPFRLATDIDECLKRCHTTGADSCVSVQTAETPPEWLYTSRDGRFIEPWLRDSRKTVRRQDARQLFALNGAVYSAPTAWILEGQSFLGGRVVPYEMPSSRSLDIDTEWDWFLASLLAESLSGQ